MTRRVAIAAACAVALTLAMTACAPAGTATDSGRGAATPAASSSAETSYASIPATAPGQGVPVLTPRTDPSAGLDPATYAWNFQRTSTHKVPQIPSRARALAARYGAVWTGPDRTDVYLTFDEGYENGNTPAILDALKAAGVHATFFVTEEYIKEAPKLVNRMLAEGHIVGSHSAKHPSMPKLTGDRAKFDAQFSRVETAVKKATGRPITRLFRPPMGDYSEKSLRMTNALGYTTVFWSFAHGDYDEKNQPPVATTVQRILECSHPGAVYLLHGMSGSDTKALPAAIRGLRAQGFGFGTLEPNR